MKTLPAFISCLLLAAVLGIPCSAAPRPNILFIISDDQGRLEFNFLPEGRDEQGNPRNLSPNIDRLAGEGVVLLNQYVTSPVCTPRQPPPAPIEKTPSAVKSANVIGVPTITGISDP